MTPTALLAAGRLAGEPALRTHSDERLVDLARAGSLPAFELIVERYREPLLRYCRRFLSPERAEEAVQQTLLSAFQKIEDGNGELHLRPWLYRVAHNTAIDSLRDRNYVYEPIDENFDGVERPDQAAERRQEVRDAVTAIQHLPSRQRAAVVLRELEGRSYDEISVKLGVTPSATRQLLARARCTLRNAVSGLIPPGLFNRMAAPPPSDSVVARVADFCHSAGAAASTMAAQVSVGVAVAASAAAGAVDAPAPVHQPGQQDRAGQAKPGHAFRAAAPVVPRRSARPAPSATPGRPQRTTHTPAQVRAPAAPPAPSPAYPRPGKTGEKQSQPFAIPPSSGGLGAEGEGGESELPTEYSEPVPGRDGTGPATEPCAGEPSSCTGPETTTRAPEGDGTTTTEPEPDTPAPGTEGVPAAEAPSAGEQ